MTQLDHGDREARKRAEEVEALVREVLDRLLEFVRDADGEVESHRRNEDAERSCIGLNPSPAALEGRLDLSIPSQALGQAGLLQSLESVLNHSVNTFAPGFLDKLYASTNAPGIASELILACLNTNVHVYQVSPVLTLVEKATTRALANLFGLHGSRAGGISVQGGSASNMTSIVVARNTLFPETKIEGNAAAGRRLVMFTSSHGHYSIEKAAQACGFGSSAVVSVPVDPTNGAMDSRALERCIKTAKLEGKTPFYINATAGTTVLGSFDPFLEISVIAKRYGCWMHVDASWGGGFVLSDTLRQKLKGAELADSIAFNPHKMLSVPLTCSFLLANDLRTFQKANTLKAGYLFHSDDDEEEEEEEEEEEDEWAEPMDLADLTLQCGRRGDSLKLFLSWRYYGTKGYGNKINQAYLVAKHFAKLVTKEPDLVLVSEQTPPCLQVCFYFAPGGRLLFGGEDGQLRPSLRSGLKTLDLKTQVARMNGKVTTSVAEALVTKGFMVDFAPALEHQSDVGKFLRVVVNLQSLSETIKKLVSAIVELGKEIVEKMRKEHESAATSGHTTLPNGFGNAMQKNPCEPGHESVLRDVYRIKSTC